MPQEQEHGSNGLHAFHELVANLGPFVDEI